MGQQATVPVATADGGTPQAGQSLVVSLMSIAVIAVTSLLLKWVTVPTELTVSLATASGALVPTLVLSRRERRKSRTARMAELVSGAYRRPPVYVLIVAAGLLALVEWVALLLIMFTSAMFLYTSLEGAVTAGWLAQDQADSLVMEEAALGMVVILQWLVMMAGAIFVGRFVARRIRRHALVWAFGAIIVCQTVSLLAQLTFSTTAENTVNAMAYVLYPLASAVTIWIGVLWGQRTRGLFLANRLFRRLSETDRQAVLAMMEEANVPQRVAAHQHELSVRSRAA